MSKKKEKVKIEFSIVLQQVRELPKYALNSNLYLECKRGKKPKNLKTSATVTSKEANISLNNEKLSFEVNMFQNPKTQQWEPKKQILIVLKDQHPGLGKNNEKKGSALFQTVVNLTDYASPNLIKTEILKFSDKKEKLKTNLVCKIETRFMKVGDKELVKADASAVSTPSTPVVAIGGEKFALKQTNDVTETNVSMSDDEYDKDDFPDEDDGTDEDIPPPKNTGRASTISTPVKKPDGKKEVSEDRSREIAQLQQELDDLKRDKSRAEKKAERLQKELTEAKEEIEDLKSQLSDASRSSSNANQSKPTNNKSEGIDPSEFEDLKRDKSRLEKKVQKLQSELDEEKRTNQQLLQSAKESEGRKSTEEPNGKARPRLSTFAVNATTPARSLGTSPSNSTSNAGSEGGNNAELVEKLEKASAATEEIMDSILKHIHKNTISNTSAEIEESIHWLAFSVTLFKVLRNGTVSIQVDKKSLKKPIRSKDLAQLDSLTRFLHNVKNLIYEVYCALLHNIYNQLEPSLQQYLDGLSKGKDQFELPPVLNEVFRSLKVEGVSGFVSGHIVTQIFRHIDSQLFNMLLKKTNIFKTGFGFKLKMLISRLEMATGKSIKANLNTTYQSGEHLHFIKEAANLLVMDKAMMSDSDVRNQMFTHLNPVQIAYFLKYFEPDEDAPDPVPNSVKRAVDEDVKRQGNNASMQMDSFHIENINLVNNLL